MRLPLLAAAGLASLVLASPAAAQTTEPPTGASYFFQCTNPTKVHNLESASWSATKPAASYTTGAGCGSADPGLLVTQFGVGPALTNVDFYGGGKHTGVIESINVELHSLLVSRARLGAIGAEAQLTIDGNEVVLAEDLDITPETSATGATEKYVFSFSRKKPAGSAVVPPLAAGAGEHTIELRFSSYYLDYQHAWVWGASEIPSGVTVNPAALASPKITP